MAETRMTTPPGGGAECPDFEVLSRFADGELPGAAAGDVQTHLDACGRCATLAVRLQDGFGAAAASGDAGVGGTGCVGEERLILYHGGALADDEAPAVERHLAACDPCVASLARLHLRLGLQESVARAVPAALQARALAAFAPEQSTAVAPVQRAAATGPGWREALADWLGGLFQLPLAVPAMAAVALLVMAVGVQQRWTAQPVPDGIRAVNMETHLRVRAPQALIRALPRSDAEVVETVERGTVLEVAGEDRHWYRVVLPGARQGWVERDVFE